jgi:hypothetical protein
MGISYNSSIVTSGLILCLDAANPKSYPGSGTTWTDLSLNARTATLTNGPTYSSTNGGRIVLDGIDDYVAETTALSDAYWQSNWTVSFWVNFDTVSRATDNMLIQHGTAATRKGLHLCERSSKAYHGLYSDDLSGATTLVISNWYNLVFTLNNTTFVKQIYVNGVLDATHTGGGAYTGTGSNTRICGAVIFGTNFDGFMAAGLFYNRVLTATEIFQNYAAMRGRFGL